MSALNFTDATFMSMNVFVQRDGKMRSPRWFDDKEKITNVRVCRSIDRVFSTEEQRALVDMFFIKQRELTDDEVQAVLFFVAVGPEEELSIPF